MTPIRRFTLLLVALLFLRPVVSTGNSLPQSIGSLQLKKLQGGREAREEIDRLHGKQLPFRQGYIGTYRAERGKAKLWVSEYGTEKEAAEATGKMAEGMKRSKQKNFWHFQQIQIQGVPVFFVVGMGQAHYFFRKGLRVIWLAVDPPLAKGAIRDLVGKIP